MRCRQSIRIVRYRTALCNPLLPSSRLQFAEADRLSWMYNGFEFMNRFADVPYIAQQLFAWQTIQLKIRSRHLFATIVPQHTSSHIKRTYPKSLCIQLVNRCHAADIATPPLPDASSASFVLSSLSRRNSWKNASLPSIPPAKMRSVTNA